ncbi:GTPase IMAP family member 6-like [Saccostrea cucullata]|uniref:GTPase IMAP family member 6-like n=1 Tax=Saccostrea cuccullata TaxID=36930 RepID=UPI002ECFC648
MGNTSGRGTGLEGCHEKQSDWNKGRKLKIKIDGPLKEIRMIVVGKMGVGKSSLCNTLLGLNRFEYGDSMSAVTITAQVGCVDRFKRNIFVIDTPGFRDLDKTSDQEIIELASHICEHMLRISPGFHCIAMVLNADERFSSEDKEVIEDVKKVFGNNVMDHMILVYNKCNGQEDIENLLKTTNPEFCKLLAEVNGRVFPVYRDSADYEKQACARAFFERVDALCSDMGAIYTNEMLLEAWKAVENEIKTPHDRMRIKDLQKKIDRLRLVRYFLNLFRS